MADLFKGSISSFPHQKRSRAQKNKAFYKSCVQSGSVLIGSDYNTSIRASMDEKVSNYNLWNDIVDPKEVTRVINPHNIEADFHGVYRNYPLANASLNSLIGEERKRFFNPIVTLTNPDLINQKMEGQTATLNEFLLQQVLANSYDKEDATNKIQQQSKWLKFNYRDRRERMASQIVKYGMATLDMKETLSRCYEDLLIAGEEIAISEILGGEPIVRKGNPVNIYTIRSSETPFIEDSDIIVEVGYIPVGQAIDDYHDELTASDIKKLEQGHSYAANATSKLFNRQLENPELSLDSWINQQGGIGEVISANRKMASYFGGGFDEYGNVKKVRVVWKGMKKVGILPYFDENGDLQKQYVDEDYPLNEEEQDMVKWIWLSEWYEGTQLADDIFVKLGPRQVQFRSLDNPSKTHPGITGTIFNVNSSTAKSLLSLMKPYQLMYNYFMHKLWEELKTYKGKLAKINLSMIPDGWSMDQFLYYLEQMKIVFENPFNEGNKGAALGKLAGGMNQSSGSTEIGDPQVIQQLLSILEFIEFRIQDISGVTPQRKGAIQNRETVGGVERAVTQSTLNTEKLFGVHDNFKNRVIKMYLETAKVAWKDQVFKRQFILDDGSQAILDFDGSEFMESEYGVYITTATNDMEMMQTLKTMIQPFMQNGGSLAMVMELYRTQDPASLQRKLEAFEEQIRQEQQRAQQQQVEAKNREVEHKMALEQAKIEQDERESIRASETDIQVALIGAESKAVQKNSTEEKPETVGLKNRDLKIKEDSLKETIRKNRADEEIKRDALRKR